MVARVRHRYNSRESLKPPRRILPGVTNPKRSDVCQLRITVQDFSVWRSLIGFNNIKGRFLRRHRPLIHEILDLWNVGNFWFRIFNTHYKYPLDRLIYFSERLYKVLKLKILETLHLEFFPAYKQILDTYLTDFLSSMRKIVLFWRN